MVCFGSGGSRLKRAETRSSAVSEAQTANAQGGRQASLWELRSSPVPGEAELGVPESEVAAAGDGQQADEHTISQRTRMAPTMCRRLIL